MSLYRKSNTNQELKIGSLSSSLKLPVWIILVACYFSIVTLTNRFEHLITFIGIIDISSIDDIYRYIIIDLLGLLPVVALALYILRRNVFFLYYLILISLVNLIAHITSITEGLMFLHPYTFFLHRLDAIPGLIFKWLIGWNNVSTLIKTIMSTVESVASVSFCAILLYFHRKKCQLLGRSKI
jgi:hypothetical protein